MNKFGASTDTSGIESETDKIDSAAVDGLLGVNNSLAYKVHEIERHFHNSEKWFGAAVTASGETHVADRMGVADDPFTLTAGNDAFGDWVQILGSSDTPVTTGAAEFDAHRVLVSSTNSTNPFVIQIVAGESSGIAAKLASEEYSESPYISATNNNDSGIEEVMVRRTETGEKVWARTRCLGGDGSTISFFFGIHEYEG